MPVAAVGPCGRPDRQHHVPPDEVLLRWNQRPDPGPGDGSATRWSRPPSTATGPLPRQMSVSTSSTERAATLTDWTRRPGTRSPSPPATPRARAGRRRRPCRKHPRRGGGSGVPTIPAVPKPTPPVAPAPAPAPAPAWPRPRHPHRDRRRRRSTSAPTRSPRRPGRVREDPDPTPSPRKAIHVPHRGHRNRRRSRPATSNETAASPPALGGYNFEDGGMGEVLPQVRHRPGPVKDTTPTGYTDTGHRGGHQGRHAHRLHRQRHRMGHHRRRRSPRSSPPDEAGGVQARTRPTDYHI